MQTVQENIDCTHPFTASFIFWIFALILAAADLTFIYICIIQTALLHIDDAQFFVVVITHIAALVAYTLSSVYSTSSNVVACYLIFSSVIYFRWVRRRNPLLPYSKAVTIDQDSYEQVNHLKYSVRITKLKVGPLMITDPTADSIKEAILITAKRNGTKVLEDTLCVTWPRVLEPHEKVVVVTGLGDTKIPIPIRIINFN